MMGKRSHHVRFGSDCEVTACRRHVRFTPEHQTFRDARQAPQGAG